MVRGRQGVGPERCTERASASAYGLPQGALASHHKTANIANNAHQSALVAWCVTMANMMLITMQISATIFPTPKVMSSPSLVSTASEKRCGRHPMG